MSSRKTNVYIETQDPSINSLVSVSCGEFQDKDIKYFFKKLKNTPSPQFGCISELKIKHTKLSWFNFISKNKTKTDELHIELSPNTMMSECDCLTHKSCISCIANGKCKNNYIKNTIGESFFANQYSR